MTRGLESDLAEQRHNLSAHFSPAKHKAHIIESANVGGEAAGKRKWPWADEIQQSIKQRALLVPRRRMSVDRTAAKAVAI